MFKSIIEVLHAWLHKFAWSSCEGTPTYPDAAVSRGHSHVAHEMLCAYKGCGLHLTQYHLPMHVAQAAMALSEEQRAALLAEAEAMVARLSATFTAHKALLRDLRELPLAASAISPKSAAVRVSVDVSSACRTMRITSICSTSPRTVV